jgi:hypothetical protein
MKGFHIQLGTEAISYLHSCPYMFCEAVAITELRRMLLLTAVNTSELRGQPTGDRR